MVLDLESWSSFQSQKRKYNKRPFGRTKKIKKSPQKAQKAKDFGVENVVLQQVTGIVTLIFVSLKVPSTYFFATTYPGPDPRPFGQQTKEVSKKESLPKKKTPKDQTKSKDFKKPTKSKTAASKKMTQKTHPLNHHLC